MRCGRRPGGARAAIPARWSRRVPTVRAHGETTGGRAADDARGAARPQEPILRADRGPPSDGTVAVEALTDVLEVGGPDPLQTGPGSSLLTMDRGRHPARGREAEHGRSRRAPGRRRARTRAWNRG